MNNNLIYIINLTQKYKHEYIIYKDSAEQFSTMDLLRVELYLYVSFLRSIQ